MRWTEISEEVAESEDVPDVVHVIVFIVAFVVLILSCVQKRVLNIHYLVFGNDAYLLDHILQSIILAQNMNPFNSENAPE